MQGIIIVAFVAVVVVAAAVFWVGSFGMRVAGRWRDGDRIVQLRQWGPILRGHCDRPGGGELYKGSASLGRVNLRRYDYGLAHVQSMGFEPDVAKLVNGRATALFRFAVRDSQLVGTFEGRKFTFSKSRPPRIEAVGTGARADRAWQRVSD